jgi:hypothetical protein
MKPTTAEIIATAESIEISNVVTRVALFEWDSDKRTWLDITQPTYHAERSGREMWMLLDLARRAHLTVAAWKNGERLA